MQPINAYGHPKTRPSKIDRRDFLRMGGAGLAGAVLLGPLGSGTASARDLVDASAARSLVREFEAAAREYGVPADLLMAMGYVNTRWEMPPPEATAYEKGDPHGRGTYGIMALVQNPFSDTLGKAARLTGIPESRLKTNRAANIRGGAALLAEAAGGRKPREVSGFLPALEGRGRAAGRDFTAVAGVGGGGLYAEQVSQAVEGGAAEKLRSGESSILRKPTLSAMEDEGREFAAVRRKPYVKWYPAHPKNYTSANRPRSHRITHIVIHVTQGSWASAINWFQNPASGVSAHYTIRSRDGFIGQSVSDINIAYHAGNWNYNQHSIGIEHEGYVSNPRWFTAEMYRSSARLTAYLCRRYRIPIKRSRIIGHNEVPGADHTDPGKWWWWSYYMRRVRRFARR